MAKKVDKVGKIAKEKKPFDKTYIPLIFAFIVLALLVGALIYTITRKPKDKPVMNDTNTARMEEIAVDNKNTICPNDELNELISKAKKITAKYEEIDDYIFGYEEENSTSEGGAYENGIVITGYALRMTIENISPDLTIMVKNNISDHIDIIKDSQESSFVWEEGETTFVRSYFVEIYANTPSCPSIPLRTFSFQIPKWNEASKNVICSDPDLKDKEICKHFVFDNKDFSSKYKELEEEVKQAGKEEYKREQENKEASPIRFVKNNYIYILLIVGIIIVVAVIVIIVLKGRKQK